MNYFLNKDKVTDFINYPNHDEKFDEKCNCRTCDSKSKIDKGCSDKCTFNKCTNAHDYIPKNLTKYKTKSCLFN